MPRLSIEGAIGIAAGIILFVLDKMEVGGTWVYIGLFAVAAVLCFDSVVRSEWARSDSSEQKRRQRVGGAIVFIIFVGFGTWIFWPTRHNASKESEKKQPVESKPAQHAATSENSVSPEHVGKIPKADNEAPSPPQRPQPIQNKKTGNAARVHIAEPIPTTYVHFQRPEVQDGIPFTPNKSVTVNERAINKGPSIAGGFRFHVGLTIIELPPTKETEDRVWQRLHRSPA